MTSKERAISRVYPVQYSTGSGSPHDLGPAWGRATSERRAEGTSIQTTDVSSNSFDTQNSRREYIDHVNPVAGPKSINLTPKPWPAPEPQNQ